MAVVVTDAIIEAYIEDKVKHKFHVIEAKEEANKRHRRELRTWAQVADVQAMRQKTYEMRRDWVKRVLKTGLVTETEAMRLVKLLFPF